MSLANSTGQIANTVHNAIKRTTIRSLMPNLA